MANMVRKHKRALPSGGDESKIQLPQIKLPKIQPQIRIIHIFAPEIIKTDVANFRELVQRLTGKPTVTETEACMDTDLPRLTETSSSTPDYDYKPADLTKDYCFGVYSDQTPQGGFLGEFDGLNDYFLDQVGEFDPDPPLHHHPHHFQDTLHSISY